MKKEDFHADLSFSKEPKVKDVNTSFHSEELSTDTNENTQKPYAPKMRNDYNPSDEECESATGVDFPINMPNPATDRIVSNNIAYMEFDYTEDPLSEDD